MFHQFHGTPTIEIKINNGGIKVYDENCNEIVIDLNGTKLCGSVIFAPNIIKIQKNWL
jgi:hypothetical protein